MSGTSGLRFNFPKHDANFGGPQHHHDAPLFQRMGVDDFNQLQDCRQIIDSLHQRVHDLERINVDLEYRLEDQAKQCMEVEKECVAIERKWKAKCDSLEKEILNWKEQYEAQKLKGDRLREHLSRTERELYGILQRKYELIRGPGGRPAGGSQLPPQSREGAGGAMRRNDSNNTYGSQEEFLTTQQARAPQEIRQRRMLASLSDFLGF